MSDTPSAAAPPVEDLGIYQVPRSIAVNSNLSNNQNHRVGGSAQNASSRVDIYSNMEFSPPPGASVQQASFEQQKEATAATIIPANDRSPKAVRTFTSTSSVDEPISTVDPELLVALDVEEKSHAPSRGGDDSRTVPAEVKKQSPLLLPPRIPRSQTVASPAVQEAATKHTRPTPVSGIKKPRPPPPPVFRKNLKSLHTPHSPVGLNGEQREKNDPAPLVKQLSDPAVARPSVRNRPLPSPPTDRKPPHQPGIVSQSPTGFRRPPLPPPYLKKQPGSAEKSSNQGAVGGKSSPGIQHTQTHTHTYRIHTWPHKQEWMHGGDTDMQLT